MASFFDWTTIILLGIFLCQGVLFLRFYKREGTYAVYHAWYAWIIDLCAVGSGTFLMGLALYLHHVESFGLPIVFVYGLFIVGSWQALIHGVKWYVRSMHNKKEEGPTWFTSSPHRRDHRD